MMIDWIDFTAGQTAYSPYGERLRVIWTPGPDGGRIWSFALEDDGGDLVMDAAAPGDLIRYELQLDGGLVAHYAGGACAQPCFDVFDIQRIDDEPDPAVWGWIAELTA